MKNKKPIIAIILLLLICTLGACGNAKQSTPIKVILDCDMGHMNDDALCLSMLLKAEERGMVEILGITLEGGNNYIDAAYFNYGETQYGSSTHLSEFLKSINREDIPYYRGTDFPDGFNKENILDLDAYYKGLDYIKFDDGYGAIHFFGEVDPELLCDSNDAARFLTKTVRENPDEVVIFAIGPTMNIAEAVRSDAEFAAHVKAIYYMGGALGDDCMHENTESELVAGIEGANVTPVTEYNVLYDPTAFYTCITAAFPKQYVSPGSNNIYIDQEIADRFIESSNGSAIANLWVEHYKKTVQDFPYWDPMTVYAFLCPEAITKSSPGYVTVNTNRSEYNFGRTDSCSADEYEKLSAEEKLNWGQAEVIYELDGFWDYTIELLCK